MGKEDMSIPTKLILSLAAALGGGLVLTTLAAVLLFKERLSVKQWIGVAFGIISVVFLCNPFA